MATALRPRPRVRSRHALRLPIFEAASVTLLKRLTLVIDDGTIAHVFDPVAPSVGAQSRRTATTARQSPVWIRPGKWRAIRMPGILAR